MVQSGGGRASLVARPHASLPPRRCVLTYCPSEGLPALQVVGRVLYEQAVAFYAADAQASRLSMVERSLRQRADHWIP